MIGLGLKFSKIVDDLSKSKGRRENRMETGWRTHVWLDLVIASIMPILNALFLES